MKPLYTQSEYEVAKSFDSLSLECYSCKKMFYKEKRFIKQVINKSKTTSKCKYCKICSKKRIIKAKCVNCKMCNKKIIKKQNEINKSKSGNHFCCKSCSATYNNTHKTHGTRISKLEVWLQEQLTILYPNLQFDFNKKDLINSELDIYIPSLKLAFELNGIFHYEPIYGEDKLDQIQNNDQRKFAACIEMGISLCIIDVSRQSYFKPKSSQKFIDIIINIINNKT